MPIAVDASQQGGRFCFISLPTDLIYHIVKRLLPRESVIALALTSKSLNSFLGHRLFANLNAQEKWRLLLLLERDTDLLVACPQCQILHGPFMAGNFHDTIGYSHYFNSTDLRSLSCLKNRHYPHTPQGVTPALCRLIARRHIRRQRYGELLAMAGVTKLYTLVDFKFFGTTKLRMIDGNLYAREEVLVARLTAEGDVTGRSAYLLNGIMTGPGGHLTCRHLPWATQDVHLASDTLRGPIGPDYCYSPCREFSKDYRFATAHKKFIDAEADEDCSDGHIGPECYDSTAVRRHVLDAAFSRELRCAVLHLQPCERSCCGHRINGVQTCKKCATDTCFSAQDVEGIGRVIGLTTWKNLGGVNEGQPLTWLTHCRGLPRAYRDIGQLDRGSEPTVSMVFDKVTVIEPYGRRKAPEYHYKPSLGGRVKSVFSEIPKPPMTPWPDYNPMWDCSR